MTAHRPSVMTIHAACGAALIGLAVKTGSTPEARKRNLATLYETGAISGEAFALALKTYGLEAA